MRRVTLILGVAVLALLLAGRTYSAIHYCDLTLTANGAGTALGPWQWSQAIDAANVAAGDTVNLKGTKAAYAAITATNAKGTMGNVITYQQWSGQATAVFPYITITGPADFYLRFQGIKVAVPDDGVKRNGITMRDVHHVSVLNCEVDGVWKTNHWEGMTERGILVDNGGDIEISNCNVHDCYNCVYFLHTIDAPVAVRSCHLWHMSGMGIQWDTQVNPARLTVEGNVIECREVGYYAEAQPTNATHSAGIALWKDNADILRNVIRATGNTNLLRTYPDIAPPNGFCNLRIENNLIYDGSNTVAVYLTNLGSNVWIVNNTIVSRYKYYPVSPYKAQTYEPALKLGFHALADCNSVHLINNLLVGQLECARTIDEDYNLMWSWWTGTTFRKTPIGSHSMIVAYAGSTSQVGSYNPPFSGDVFAAGFFIGNPLFATYHAQYPYPKENHGQDLTLAYQLLSDAIAVNAGTAVNAPTVDLRGVARDIPDIGCYEVAVVPPPNAPPVIEGPNSSPVSLAGLDETQIAIDPVTGQRDLRQKIYTYTGTDVVIAGHCYDPDNDDPNYPPQPLRLWREPSMAELPLDPNGDYRLTVSYLNSGWHYETLCLTDGLATRKATIAVFTRTNKPPTLGCGGLAK